MERETLEIEAAKASIMEARCALETALTTIVAAPRAEKETIGLAIQEAFEKLKAAQAILAALEPLTSPDVDK
jgi:hypothetical protein